MRMNELGRLVLAAVAIAAVATAGSLASRLDASENSCLAQMGADLNGKRAHDSFGYSVDLSANGGHLVASAPIAESARVRVFEWVSGSWSVLGNTNFVGTGEVVRISGNGMRIAVIGNGLRVYDLNESNKWVQVGHSIGADDGFMDMSATGQKLTFSSTQKDRDGVERTYVKVYEKSSSSSQWQQLGGDILPDEEGLGGFTVALSKLGNVLVVGAPLTGGQNLRYAGRVRVYKLNAAKLWTQLGQTFSGETSEQRLGTAVAINRAGNRIAFVDRNMDTFEDRTQVFDLTDGSSWTQVGQSITGGDIEGLPYRSSVQLTDYRLVIGNPYWGEPDEDDEVSFRAGAARVFELSSSDSTWVKLGIVTGQNLGDMAGSAVAISADGNKIAVGASSSDGDGAGYMAGQVRLFKVECKPSPTPTM